MVARLEDLELAESGEKMTDEQLREHYRRKHADPLSREERMTEREFYADQYSCPDRLFR